MKNSEYNNFNEIQRTDECQIYEAVQISVSNKEMYTPKNESLITEEYGDSKKYKNLKSNKNDKGFVRKIIQKVSEVASNIAGGIAATASVAISSVVILASVLIKAPNIELLELAAGYNYVSYNLYIDEMDENLAYYSIVSNNFETYRYELNEGENINEISNLRHDMKYNLSVVGINKESSEETKYFNTTFYTTTKERYITIQWVVEGEVVERDEIEYGSIPEYNGETPTKESTSENNYIFKEWLESVDDNGNITYTAEFESSIRMYIVNWVVEGVVVERDEIEYGSIPEYNGETPTKEGTVDEDYEFFSWDKEIVAVSEDITYTAVFNIVQHQYTATLNYVEASAVGINYDNPDYYVMTFNTGFDNDLDTRLAYKIILTDDFTLDTYVYEGTDPIATINVPTSSTLLSITYETIGIYNDVEKVFDSITMADLLEISIIFVNLSDDLILVGTDEYQLSVNINTDYPDKEVYNSLSLVINYSDSSSREILIENVIVNENMIVNIPVPAYCSSFTIDYTVDLLGDNGNNPRIISGSQEFILESSFELIRVYADTNEYMKVRFLFKYHFTDLETTIAVKDVLTTSVTTMYEGEDFIEVYLDETLSQSEFTYYLANLDGTIKGSEESIVINMDSITGVYEFHYVNPGNAVVTFNEDETMNIYLNTTFETEDADIWYLVRYTDFRNRSVYDIKYNESIAYLENIPFSDYGIEYFVYKTVDGIEYQLENVSVSGGIELTSSKLCEGTVTEIDSANVNVYLYYYDYYDINSESFVIVVDGSRYEIPSSQVVFNDGTYEINYLLDYMPNELIVEYEKIFNDQTMYEQIIEKRQIIGVQNKTMYLKLI